MTSETQMQQRTQEWYEARWGRITASNVGAILGVDPYRTREDIMRMMIREAKGAPSEFITNPAIEYGTYNERNALWDLKLKIEEDCFKPCGFFPYEEWLGASPDGLLYGEKILEIKCPYSQKDENPPRFKSLDAQPHYYAQVQIQMLCTRKLSAIFYQRSMYGDDITDVTRDEEWLVKNIPILREFYDEYIEHLNGDCSQYLNDKVVKNDTAIPEVDAYLAAKAEYDEATERLEKAKQALIDAADGAKKTDFGKLTVTKVKKEGAIGYAKMVKDLLPDADTEPYKGKASEYWMIKVSDDEAS